MRRRKKLVLAGAAALLLLGGGAAAAYLIVTRPVPDVHNGLSSPFTSTPEPTTSTPSTGQGRKVADVGPPWPMYGRNAAHNRDASELKTIAPPYGVVWTRPAHGILEYPPSYVNKELYVAADAGWVGAYHARDWQADLVAQVHQGAEPAGLLPRPRLLRVVRPHRLRLDAATGRTVWRRAVGTEMESPPTVAEGRVFAGGLDGTVRALDWKTGRVIWVYHTSGAVKSAISLSGGRLYFGDYAGVMYCLRAPDARVMWRSSTNGLSSGFRSGTFYSTPNVRYGRVYVGNTDGKLYSFVASSGRIAWSHSMGGWVYGSPAVWTGLVFEASYDGTFQAMDARTGAVRWSRKLPYATTASPTVVGRYVYVASHGRTNRRGNLWAFNPRTGRQVWHFNDGWYSTVVTAGTDALVVAGPAHLYFLRTR